MYILLFPSCILQCILLLDVSKKDTSALLEQDQSEGFMESSSLYLSFSQRGVLRERKRKENRFYQWSSFREDSEFKIKIDFEVKQYFTRKFKGSSVINSM